MSSPAPATARWPRWATPSTADTRLTRSRASPSWRNCGRIQNTNCFWHHNTQASKEKKMKKFTWTFALVVPCFAVVALFAEKYTITLTVDPGTGNITYDHKGSNNKKASHGGHGHQVVSDNDTIVW